MELRSEVRSKELLEIIRKYRVGLPIDIHSSTHITLRLHILLCVLQLRIRNWVHVSIHLCSRCACGMYVALCLLSPVFFSFSFDSSSTSQHTLHTFILSSNSFGVFVERKNGKHGWTYSAPVCSMYYCIV